MSFCWVWSFLVLTEADCLAELLVCRFLFSPPPPHSCSATSAQCVSKCARSVLQQRPADRLPGIWPIHVYFWRRCFVPSPIPYQQVEKSSGGGTSVKKHTLEGETGRRRKLRFFSCFRLPGFVARWAECGVRHSAFFSSFFPPPFSTIIRLEWKSWSRAERVWMYSGSTTKSPNMRGENAD